MSGARSPLPGPAARNPDLKRCRRATVIDPGCSVCWNNLGKSLTDQNRHAEAEAAYRRALDLRPNRAKFASNLTTALYAHGKHTQAEEERRAGRTLEAMVLLQGALAVMPGDVEARRRLDALEPGRGGAGVGRPLTIPANPL